MNRKFVFYIDNMYRGGAQRVMSIIINYLARNGYEITLINDYPQNDNSEVYSIDSRIKRKYLRGNKQGNSFNKNISRIYNLRRLICEFKPDCVVSFLGRPNYRMLISTVGLKTKKIVSVRNDPNKEYGSKAISKLVANQIFRLADGCVFQTKGAQSYFNRCIVKKSRIILNPIDSTFYQVEKQPSSNNIVYIGRLEEQKNLLMLIISFAQVLKKHPNEKLLIYGQGSLENYLKKIVLERSLEDNILFMGMTNDVPNILASAKLFIMTSNYEGLPNALMEAFAAGVPSITTDCPCGGPRELFGEDCKQFLVPCNDYEKLTETINMLLNDDLLRNSLSSRLKEKAEVFREETILQQWESYICNI